MCLRIPCAILAGAIFSGCLTLKNNKDIREYRSPINEFDRTLRAGAVYHVSKGRMVTHAGKTVLQFDGVLIGEGRFLNVDSSPQGLRFYESSARLPEGKPVYLVQQNACCMEDQAFRTVLFLKPGQQLAVTDILRQHFRHGAEAVGEPAALLVLDFSNIYTFSAMHAFWENGPGVSYFVQSPGSDYGEVLGEIGWGERSRLRLAGMYGWYAVTVPVDILTGPFQVAGLLLLGRGMVK